MRKEKTGFLLVVACYVCWGMLSIFWSLLSEVNALYILTQRIFWSLILMGIYLLLTGKKDEIMKAVRDRKIFMQCFVSGILVTINWGIYIVAVSSGHVLDASMGYFIEPIMVAVLGVMIFKEKLSKYEIITFLLASVGVIYLLIASGTVPVMALVVALSFALYGAVKKNVSISAQLSLFLETLCVAPLAIIYIVYCELTGNGSLGVLQGAEFLLLPACGLVTLIPLLLFNIGVKQIPYYLSGILMYINPTLQFLVGLLYFHEALDQNRFTAFIFIWLGALFTVYEKLTLLKKGDRT